MTPSMYDLKHSEDDVLLVGQFVYIMAAVDFRGS